MTLSREQQETRSFVAMYWKILLVVIVIVAIIIGLVVGLTSKSEQEEEEYGCRCR